MPIWAIVPVKPFRDSKSRLCAVLSAEEREALSRELLTRTLGVLKDVPEVARTLVISRDPSVLTLARLFGARTVTESGPLELNAALRRAVGVAAAFGAGGVLILPADLPMVSTEDVREFLSGSSAPGLAIVGPDRRSDGTNAMFLRPPEALSPAYGPGSFQRHLALAAERGVETRTCCRPGIEFDLDLPGDLADYIVSSKAASLIWNGDPPPGAGSGVLPFSGNLHHKSADSSA